MASGAMLRLAQKGKARIIPQTGTHEKTALLGGLLAMLYCLPAA